ncbi:hypothetical protein [Hyphomonas sp. CY54-11-8]|uniref:hypothetical protein n=1 Tax=Hyphomonas sp. CY54-11-8 TaxID=1280944 RepID=UPI0004591695|nr:hypothetical protein [Hyphomonas sp. CY54-11-8]KCZ47258.1 hypothetical protein HY17_19145 [Hyphomonas sp. CY54-11-8]
MIVLRMLLGGIWSVALIAAITFCWADLTSGTAPQKVHDVLPFHAGALEQVLRSEVEQQIANKEFVADTVGGQLSVKAPLVEWSFIEFALQANSEGRDEDAEQLMLAAYDRNPRNLFTLGWLAQIAFAEGQGGDALGWLDRMVAIDPRLGGDVGPVALDFVFADGGVAMLEQLLRNDRNWTHGIVRELNKNSDDIPVLIELNRLAPGQQDAFISRLLRERGPEVAFIAWLSLLEEGDASNISWPIDPAFSGIDLPRPFNWALDPNGTEMMKEGGLYAIYFGRGRPSFARQTMMLRPGNYSFVTEFSGRTQESAGRLVWEISCLHAATPLASLNLENPAGEETTATTEFVVPAQECAAQQLILRGVPGEFPARVGITTRSVHIGSPEP